MRDALAPEPDGKQAGCPSQTWGWGWMSGVLGGCLGGQQVLDKWGGWSGVQGRREVLDNSWPPPSLLRLSKLRGSGGPPNRWEAEPLSSWGK